MKKIYEKIANSFSLVVNDEGMVCTEEGDIINIDGKPVKIIKANEMQKHFKDGEYDIIPFNVLKENKIKGVNPVTKKLFSFLDVLQEATVRNAMKQVLISIYEKTTVYDVGLIEVLNRLTATSGKAKTVVDDETLSVFETVFANDEHRINKLTLRHNRKVDGVLQHTVIVNRFDKEYWYDKIKNAGMRKRDERLFTEMIDVFTFDKYIAWARDDNSPDIIAVLKALLTISDKLSIYKVYDGYLMPTPVITWSDVVDMNMYIKEANMLPTVTEEVSKTNNGEVSSTTVTNEAPTLAELQKSKALLPAQNSTGNDLANEIRLKELEIEKLKLESNGMILAPTRQTTILQPMVQQNNIGGLQPLGNDLAPWEDMNTINTQTYDLPM